MKLGEKDLEILARSRSKPAKWQMIVLILGYFACGIGLYFGLVIGNRTFIPVILLGAVMFIAAGYFSNKTIRNKMAAVLEHYEKNGDLPPWPDTGK